MNAIKYKIKPFIMRIKHIVIIVRPYIIKLRIDDNIFIVCNDGRLNELFVRSYEINRTTTKPI